MGLLYGRAGRVTAENGGFRPGQWPRCAGTARCCGRWWRRAPMPRTRRWTARRRCTRPRAPAGECAGGGMQTGGAAAERGGGASHGDLHPLAQAHARRLRRRLHSERQADGVRRSRAACGQARKVLHDGAKRGLEPLLTGLTECLKVSVGQRLHVARPTRAEYRRCALVPVGLGVPAREHARLTVLLPRAGKRGFRSAGPSARGPAG